MDPDISEVKLTNLDNDLSELSDSFNKLAQLVSNKTKELEPAFAELKSIMADIKTKKPAKAISGQNCNCHLFTTGTQSFGKLTETPYQNETIEDGSLCNTVSFENERYH